MTPGGLGTGLQGEGPEAGLEELKDNTECVRGSTLGPAADRSPARAVAAGSPHLISSPRSQAGEERTPQQGPPSGQELHPQASKQAASLPGQLLSIPQVPVHASFLPRTGCLVSKLLAGH